MSKKPSLIATRIKLKRDSTQNWNAAQGFVPLQGEVIIYDDYSSRQEEKDGEIITRNIPNIKIGDGKAYVQDLPFVNEELRGELLEHINNPDIHVTSGEKISWNNKVTIDDWSNSEAEIIDGNLVFSRD